MHRLGSILSQLLQDDGLLTVQATPAGPEPNADPASVQQAGFEGGRRAQRAFPASPRLQECGTGRFVLLPQ